MKRKEEDIAMKNDILSDEVDNASIEPQDEATSEDMLAVYRELSERLRAELIFYAYL